MNRRELLQMQVAGLWAEQYRGGSETHGTSADHQATPAAFTQSDADDRYQQLHPATPAEIARSVVPTDLSASLTPYADVRRYGVIGDGNTDDTLALQAALRIDTANGLALVIPYGLTVKITSYVEIFSNTTLCILGKLQLTGRQSGLFTNGADNVGIYGNKIGQIQDSTVVAKYQWNASTNYAPAIHVRSGSSVLIDGLNVSYCSSGIFISSATKNWLPGVNWTLTQAPPKNVTVQNCTIQFCEMSGIALLVGYNSGFYNNYVYRCGDGGIWMMGSQSCEVIGNHRISPQSVIADVKKYGYNNIAHPTTWNDEQGIEFQSSFDLLIADNVVENFAFFGIDVKEYCNRVIITRNRVRFCEQASIIVREGDAGNVGPVGKVAIIGNFITNHGYALISETPAHSTSGAISVSSCFIADIIDNVIYSYRMTPGIVCLGPGPWQAGPNGRYFDNPQQASLVLTGNTIDFAAPMAMDTTEAPFTSATLGAILINGAYTNVKCDGNHIRTDRYRHSDIRANPSAAISLTYLKNGPAYFYPTSASIANNEVVGWGNTGIAVAGQGSMATSGLSVNGNMVCGAGAAAISLTSTHRAICNSNNIAQSNAMTVPSYGILLVGETTGLNDVVCSGNSITGSSASRGGNSLSYGIAMKQCKEINCTNNSINDCIEGPFSVENATGNVFTQGSSTFPRSGAPPDGNVISYHQGEMYYDTTNNRWWIATTFASAAWTQLSN